MPSKTDYVLIGVGVLGAFLLASYVPGIVKSASTKTLSAMSTLNTTTSLEQIEGIDLNSLHIARQNGF